VTSSPRKSAHAFHAAALPRIDCGYLEHPMPTNTFDSVKVFSATKWRDRELLGETITSWIAANPSVSIVDKVVRQSSDSAYHCLSIVLFIRG
jgi:hypothetical protein